MQYIWRFVSVVFLIFSANLWAADPSMVCSGAMTGGTTGSSGVVTRSGSSDSPSEGRKHLLGLSRDREGKLVPIFSEDARLSSIRGGVGEDWVAAREMTQIPLAISQVSGFSLDAQSSDYDHLPKHLREIFAQNKILVTASSGEETSEYSIQIAVALIDDGPNQGRTGFLLYKGEPVVVEISGKEFLVEIKGVGRPEGGYRYDHPYRTILGGLLLSQADSEFMQIESERISNPAFALGNTVRVAARLSFDSPKGRQGYLIRLSPGSMRASFRDNPEIRVSQAQEDLLARKAGEIWGYYLARGLVPMTHFENLIANVDYSDFILTDYADIIPIGTYPLWDRKPDDIVITVMWSITEMPGYDYERHFPLFYQGLLKALGDSQRLSSTALYEVGISASLPDIARALWKRHLQLEYYRQHRDAGWIPTPLGNVQLDHEDFRPGYFSRELVTKLRHAQFDLLDNLGVTQQRLNRAQQDQDQRMVRNGQRAVERMQRDLDALTETQFSLEGLLYLVQTNEFLREFWISGRSSRYLAVSSRFGRNTEDLRRISDYLRRQIIFLGVIEKMVSGFERAEVLRNLKVAKERYLAIQKMGPYQFHLRMQTDPEFLLRSYMLPYHSQRLDLSGYAMDHLQYKRHAADIQRMILAGELEEN